MQKRTFLRPLPLAAIVCSLPVLVSAQTARAATQTIKQDVAAMRDYMREPGVDVSGDRIHLTKSFIVQDEIGETNQESGQPLSATMWAKKTFVVPYAADAELLFFGQARDITVNGHKTEAAKLVPSTGWMYVPVQAAWLHKGNNDVVFSGGGGLLIENSLFPDRSARSTDGGRTWQNDELGPDGIHNGEYVVRLRLKGYAPKATLTSDVIDLVDPEHKNSLHPQVKVDDVSLAPIQARADAGTTLQFEARLGNTPIPDNSWTIWTTAVAGKDQSVALTGRYLQWRAKFQTTSADATPSFSGVTITAAETAAPLPANIRVTSLESHPIIKASDPFAFQGDSARLKILRDKYKLQDVIAPGKTELEKLVLLRDWARNQWPNGWAHDDLNYCPPWDALLILDMAPREQALGMCTHYSTVFVQCALALGWNARHLLLDHHCAAEVWSDDLGKWIVMDTGNSANPARNCYYASNGVPLSALEIHNLVEQKQLDKIQVVYAKNYGSISAPEMEKRNDQISFTNYVRFGIPFRNNHLDTPLPGELAQGLAHMFHDGYLWWQDGPVPTAYPEYSHDSYRPEDFYWNVNQVALDLQAPDNTGAALNINMATHTPNFSHYLMRVDDGEWQRQAGPSMPWPLHAGRNRVEVKTVNVFGREGKASSAVVEVGN